MAPLNRHRAVFDLLFQACCWWRTRSSSSWRISGVLPLVAARTASTGRSSRTHLNVAHCLFWSPTFQDSRALIKRVKWLNSREELVLTVSDRGWNLNVTQSQYGRITCEILNIMISAVKCVLLLCVACFHVYETKVSVHSFQLFLDQNVLGLTI